MEADSVPPGFTRINQKTPEEQEATRYETLTNSEKQSINEELGIPDVTNINEGWYARSESELPSTGYSVLQQPMEVDEALEERPYQMSDEEAPDVLGPGPRTRLSCHSYQKQGPRYTRWILQGSRGWKTNHRIWGWILQPKDYGMHHRGIDARKKTVDPEVPQMKIEDQSFKFDFHVIPSKCF